MDIFTDGGCSGNPGPGGWAYIVCSEEKPHECSGGERETTNNRMELTAVIRALEYFKGIGAKEKPRISTDSQYVQLGISKWIKNWMKNGWKTSDGKAVKNRDLWVLLWDLSAGLNPEWHWVKGHAGDHFNERCDALVQKEISKLNRP